MRLFKVRQKWEIVLIPEWHEDNTMMRKCTDCIVYRRLLSTSRCPGRYKDPGIFTVQRTLPPETTRGVPESLEVTEVPRMCADMMRVRRSIWWNMVGTGSRRSSQQRGTQKVQYSHRSFN